MEREQVDMRAIITASENIAERIKEAFWKDEPWSADIAKKVGIKLSQLKKLMRPFFHGANEIKFLRHLGNFTAQDVRDAFSDLQTREGSKERCIDNHQAKSIGAHLGRSTGIAA